MKEIYDIGDEIISHQSWCRFKIVKIDEQNEMYIANDFPDEDDPSSEIIQVAIPFHKCHKR